MSKHRKLTAWRQLVADSQWGVWLAQTEAACAKPKATPFGFCERVDDRREQQARANAIRADYERWLASLPADLADESEAYRTARSPGPARLRAILEAVENAPETVRSLLWLQ